MLHTPFYDPEKSYEENFEQGPFGIFADGEVIDNPRDALGYDFFGFKVKVIIRGLRIKVTDL